MNNGRFQKISTIVFILCFAMTVAVTAQEKSTKAVDESIKMPDGTYKTSKYDEAERPEDSYLAKFHAVDIVNKLIKENLNDLYQLKVVVTNFDAGWKADYDKCYEGYKRGMELYYKRNIIYSRLEFEKNKKDIQDLYKKVLINYKKDTRDLLNSCADKILLLHLDATTKSDPNKSRDLFLNQERLKIAYAQYDDALNAEFNHYLNGSLSHLRVAKSYAIKIMESLAKPEERNSVKEKYKVHKADILNRVYAPASDKGGTTTP